MVKQSLWNRMVAWTWQNCRWNKYVTHAAKCQYSLWVLDFSSVCLLWLVSEHCYDFLPVPYPVSTHLKGNMMINPLDFWGNGMKWVEPIFIGNIKQSMAKINDNDGKPWWLSTIILKGVSNRPHPHRGSGAWALSFSSLQGVCPTCRTGWSSASRLPCSWWPPTTPSADGTLRHFDITVWYNLSGCDFPCALWRESPYIVAWLLSLVKHISPFT